jgi:hypothetical protein
MANLTGQSLLAETVSMLRASGVRAAVALIVLTVLGFAVDMAGSEGNRLNIVITAATIGMQYWLSATLLDELGLRNVTVSRFWQMFGVCLLTNLGILLGCVLLLVPGIILMVRWSISVPHVISDENVGVIEAISRSWEETGDAFWPILLTLLVFYVPAVLAAAVAGLAGEFGSASVAGSLAFNAFLNAGAIGGWHVAVAVYAARRPESRLAETFA